MIFSKLTSALCKNCNVTIGIRKFTTTLKLNDGNYKWKQQFQRLIGNREQVGYGWNGQPEYADLSLYPFPAIRYKEPSPELKALREKEKGDWKQLTVEEKKCLYRSSFCLTFSEFQAPTGEWKSVVGGALMLIGLGLWLNIFMYTFLYSQTPVPETFCEENIMAQTRRQIDLHVNPIEGIGSEWDYEKCDWKQPKKWRQLPNPFIDPCTGESVSNNYAE